MRPWVAQTDGQAIRMFTDEINNLQGEMHKHADDYDLYRIGEFDDASGALQQETPKQICIGKNALKE